MPTSPLPKRGAKPPLESKRPRFILPFILIGVLAVLAVAVIAMPASLVRRFLPPFIDADDFSGTLWHGSAGRITVNARDIGAVEWHLHPLPLLRLTLSADLHWVKVAFVADGTVDVDRRGFTFSNFAGDGPIEALGDVGVPPGWHGTGSFKFTHLEAAFANGSATVLSAVGDVSVSALASPEVAAGADLGGYVLHIANGAVTPNADATAELSDTGGPLEVNATIHFSVKDHVGMLTGTIKERPDAPPALRSQIDNLTQIHPRDGQGRVPVDLEFTL